MENLVYFILNNAKIIFCFLWPQIQTLDFLVNTIALTFILFFAPLCYMAILVMITVVRVT
jgi:hypothetical protein